jgi:two-component system, NarL family, nitrate/nitrite sensor histidine kinase NarX
VKNKLSLYSLRNKTILAIIFITALCALVSGLIVYLVIQYELTTRYAADKEATIESLSYSLKPLLEAAEYQQVNQLIEANLIYQHINYIAVYDSNGTLIGADTSKNAEDKEYATESHDITLGSVPAGRFEIAFSRDYINDLARQTTFILVITLVAFFLIAGISLIVFMKMSVIQPLEVISRTIGKINPDNLSVRMDIRTKDEIGLLANSFNLMASDLENSQHALQEARNDLEQKVEARTRGERRRAEQLREINEVSRRISAILSLEELLPYVANSLQETFDYHNVKIYLANPGQKGVFLKAGANGNKNPVPVGAGIPRNEGIIGRVAKNGEYFSSRDVMKDAVYTFSPESEIRSEVAVPIKLGTEILGVLDIQSFEPDAFDEIDLFTAQTLGDQLAVAIDNARLYQDSRNIAILEERNRMAREIHDTLAQGFTGIILQLEAAEQSLSKDTSQIQQHIDRARSLAKESLNEARRSVWALRPQKLDQLPLETALHQETEKFTRDTGIATYFNISGKMYTLSPDIENALLRICQEALINIRKHARANQVNINISYEETMFRLSIQDNGTGFDTAVIAENHFGLVIMRERTKLLGGTIEINSEKGKGTLLEVMIPVERGTT